MGMPVLSPLPEFWTAEMVLGLPPDGCRYETAHGELVVTPAPSLWHQIVVDRLADALKRYLATEPVGMVLALPADISWGPDSLVQPDVFVAPRDEMRTLDWRRVQTLLLVAEVLSPGSHRGDRGAKRRLYQEAGVPLYWVVDPIGRTVESWTPGAKKPVEVEDVLRWHPAGTRTSFALEMEMLFSPV